MRTRGSAEVSPAVGGAMAVAAGLLWLLVWLHGANTHGTTATNEMRLWAGLTWMDSAKLLVLPFLLLVPGFLALARGGARPASRRLGSKLGPAVVAVLIVLAVATALQFWTFSWGSYDESFETIGGVAGFGGGVQSLTSVVLTVVVGAAGLVAFRANAAPLWLTPVVVVGAAFSLFLTPPSFVPGIAWLAFGLWLLMRGPVSTTGH